ncbi:MAG: TetR/AcrR family transcriptional regulator [Hyphomicrobiaceae bacterium]
MIRSTRVKRVTKGQWLAVALEELERGGVGAVRIERLAKILSVSKSGFYFHFKDRKDLHVHLLDHWFHEYTEVVTSNPLLYKGDPAARLAAVAKLIQDYDLGKYDLAIRAWAKHDEAARQAVQRVTKARMDFLREIFREIGFEADELEMRTTLFVGYHTWENATFGDMSERKCTRLRNRRLALLTKP